jgi:hypothetical protein
MLEISTCLYAIIYFKICRRTLSGCWCESYIMAVTFPKGFYSFHLQIHQNRCCKLQLVYHKKSLSLAIGAMEVRTLVNGIKSRFILSTFVVTGSLVMKLNNKSLSLTIGGVVIRTLVYGIKSRFILSTVVVTGSLVMNQTQQQISVTWNWRGGDPYTGVRNKKQI